MSLVEKRYAEALLDIAIKHERIEAYQLQLSRLLEIFKESDDLWRLLNNPNISVDIKSEILNTLFTNQVDKQILSFIKLITEIDRISEFEGIVKTFKEMALHQSNVLTVEIFTALELDQQQIDEINEKYKKIYGASTIKSVVNIDPKLIGGVMIKIGDMVYDRTLAGRLESLINNL